MAGIRIFLEPHNVYPMVSWVRFRSDFMKRFQNFLESQKVHPTVCAKWESGENRLAITFVIVFIYFIVCCSCLFSFFL